MCKATEYSKKLLAVYNEISSEYENCLQKLSRADLYQQDILHKIENSVFNACDGYKLAKELQNNRLQRRLIKNELEPLRLLKQNFIDKNMPLLNKTLQTVSTSSEKLQYLTEEKVYQPRVADIDIAEQTDSEFVYKKTKEPVKIISKVDKNLYYVHFLKSNAKSLIKACDLGSK